jgi:hypothetical protein
MNEESRPARRLPDENRSAADPSESGGQRAQATETASLLDDISAFVRRYVVMSAPQADAVALWILHTHAVDACEQSPYLAITSAEKRFGQDTAPGRA